MFSECLWHLQYLSLHLKKGHTVLHCVICSICLVSTCHYVVSVCFGWPFGTCPKPSFRMLNPSLSNCCCWGSWESLGMQFISHLPTWTLVVKRRKHFPTLFQMFPSRSFWRNSSTKNPETIIQVQSTWDTWNIMRISCFTTPLDACSMNMFTYVGVCSLFSNVWPCKVSGNRGPMQLNWGIEWHQ